MVEPPVVLKIEFPWWMLCSDNERHQGKYRRAHSPKYLNSRENLHIAGTVEVRNLGLAKPVFAKGEVFLRMRFFPPDLRRRDDSNFEKVLKDSLQGVVWRNDDQITEWHGSREDVDRERPRVELEVTRRVRG